MLVTHDVREAMRLGTFLVVMADGRVVQQGWLADVMASPADPRVAKLFADQLDDPGVGTVQT